MCNCMHVSHISLERYLTLQDLYIQGLLHNLLEYVAVRSLSKYYAIVGCL